MSTPDRPVSARYPATLQVLLEWRDAHGRLKSSTGIAALSHRDPEDGWPVYHIVLPAPVLRFTKRRVLAMPPRSKMWWEAPLS
jgi:hypothetical protein